MSDWFVQIDLSPGTSSSRAFPSSGVAIMVMNIILPLCPVQCILQIPPPLTPNLSASLNTLRTGEGRQLLIFSHHLRSTEWLWISFFHFVLSSTSSSFDPQSFHVSGQFFHPLCTLSVISVSNPPSSAQIDFWYLNVVTVFTVSPCKWISRYI